MSAPSPNVTRRGAVVRFGVFEADLKARELRKQGRRIRLQDQPFAVLALLLERPGTIISREELRDRLWPADTFVDFDHSLNTAVNKIREVLGDSASSPRFVETVARRGYRFVGDVQTTPDNQGSTQAYPTRGFPARVELPAAHRGITRPLFGLLQLMYLVFYIEALVHWQQVDRLEVFNIGAPLVPAVVIVAACVGIPLRLYLLSAVAFDYAQLGVNFHRIFLGVLVLDLLWAIAPFFLVDRIGFAPAFGSTAALLYVPFAERTLLRMAYVYDGSVAAKPTE